MRLQKQAGIKRFVAGLVFIVWAVETTDTNQNMKCTQEKEKEEKQ